MKASEVLRRYAAGERDFRQVNLRGQSFKGQDLSGADFSGADIRGTNFSVATLKGTDFTTAKAGLQKHWQLLKQLTIFIACALLGWFSVQIETSGIANYFAVYRILNSSNVPLNSLNIPSSPIRHSSEFIVLGFAAFTVWLLTIAISIVIVNKGFTLPAALPATAIIATATIFNFIANITRDKLINSYSVSFSVSYISGAILNSLIFYFLITSCISITIFVISVAFSNGFFAAVSGTSLGAVVALTPYFHSNGIDSIAYSVIVVVTVTTTLLSSSYVARYVLKEEEKFAFICTMNLAFGAIGGTSFRGANLTHANFTKAVLKSTHFTNILEKDAQGKRREHQTILDWICWQDAKKLEYARVGNSILAYSSVRELLVTRNGYKKSYIDANLRATNLDGVNLEEANLTWADLTCSTLRYANLKNANLTESLVLDTNFTGATLTGACIEAWNIDSKTNLEQVDCQYVYLLRNQQERRPSSGDFAPGEFTKLFQEALSTVDLIFRNGVDWKAFVAAFKQVQVQNEDTPLEIQSIENKGDGVVVVRVNVPPDTSKEKIHSEFNQQYELALKAIEARYQKELQAKEGEIAIYREQSANMWGVINSLANRPINRLVAE